MHGDLGFVAAYGLTGAIAVQEWVTNENEPAICEVLNHIAPLEIEPEHIGYDWQKVEVEWQKVFELAERLE